MSMKTKVAVLVASFAVLLFTVVGGLVGVRASSNDGAYRQLQVYSEVLSVSAVNTWKTRRFRPSPKALCMVCGVARCEFELPLCG